MFNRKRGLPPHSFFAEAWASEPLTNTLKETNIPHVLPMPDESLSVVATNDAGDIVGQCSINNVVSYWDQVNHTDSSAQNKSTQTFHEIHKLAAAEEQKFVGNDDSLKLHSAGVAVLPSFRGNNLGLFMANAQVEICKEENASMLFAETTNKYSAKIANAIGFEKITEYPYKDLAVELSNPDLNALDDSFTVWTRKL